MIRSTALCSSLIGNWSKPTSVLLNRRFRSSDAPDKSEIALPKFPVPQIHGTALKFSAFARVLQNDEDYQETYITANKFMESKEAERLQSLLENRAAKMNNWLTPWWIDEAYLCQRAPLPFNSSPAVMFPKFDYSGIDGQVEIAAKIISSALKYYKKIINNELKQEKIGDSFLCMNQFKRIFGTTRIPGRGKDAILYGCEKDPQPKHIMVLHNGNIFRMSVFDSNGDPLSINQLKNEIIRNILPNSQQSNMHPISVVTSSERGIWADVYAQLKDRNGDRIRMVEDSLFVVCLDHKMSHIDQSNDIDVQTLQCLHGGGCHNNSMNRWFDKTIQFIIGTDGYCGVTYEHTPAEAHPISKMMESICNEMKADKYNSKDANGSIEPTIPIKFSITDEHKQIIAQSKEAIDKLASDTDVKVYTFDHFGKEFIKDHGVSPDSYIQMALQVAYYRIYHRLACTYETATLRMFSDGRTETIRSPNFHTAMFAVDLNDPDTDIEIPTSMLMQMFRVASQQHKKFMHEAMNGRGIDRHIFGLKKIAAEHGYPEPSICRTQAYKRMMEFPLSTSQVPTRNFIPVAYGPSLHDGYGICYNPHPEKLHFTICALHSCIETSSSRFAEELENALVDIRTIMRKEYEKHK